MLLSVDKGGGAYHLEVYIFIIIVTNCIHKCLYCTIDADKDCVRVAISNFLLHIHVHDVRIESGAMVMVALFCMQGFSKPHDLTVDPVHGAVYVTEIGPNRIWKFVPLYGECYCQCVRVDTTFTFIMPRGVAARGIR